MGLSWIRILGLNSVTVHLDWNLGPFPAAARLWFLNPISCHVNHDRISLYNQCIMDYTTIFTLSKTYNQLHLDLYIDCSSPKSIWLAETLYWASRAQTCDAKGERRVQWTQTTSHTQQKTSRKMKLASMQEEFKYLNTKSK